MPRTNATADELTAAILADPTRSFWLKQALRALAQRDPLDAFHDADSLREIAELRMNETLNQQ